MGVRPGSDNSRDNRGVHIERMSVKRGSTVLSNYSVYLSNFRFGVKLIFIPGGGGGAAACIKVTDVARHRGVGESAITGQAIILLRGGGWVISLCLIIFSFSCVAAGILFAKAKNLSRILAVAEYFFSKRVGLQDIYFFRR